MRTLAEQAATATSSRLIARECQVPVELAAHRAQERSALGGDASDADGAVARALAASRVPWPAATVVGTYASAEESLARALAATSGTKVPTARDESR